MNEPIETLITKVSEKQIDLFTIDLTALARQFRQNGSVKLIEGARFIASLAHLMYLKALKLIPIEPDDDTIPYEVARELFLEEYLHFKEVARSFSVKEKEQRALFPRKPLFDRIEPEKPKLAPPISLEQFSKLFSQILEQAQKRNITISEDAYRLSDIMEELQERLMRSRLSFSQLFDPSLGKPLLIVTFLAVLELMKSQHAWLIFEDTTFYLEKVC